MAAVVGLGGETETRIAAGAGQDGGSEKRRFPALEGGGRDGASRLLERLALPEDGPTSFRIALDVPWSGRVGGRCGDRLVAAGEPGQEFGRENAAWWSLGWCGRLEGGGGVAAVRRAVRRDRRVLSSRVAFMEPQTP